MIKRLGINTDNFASGKQCLTFKQLIQGGAIPGYRSFRLDFSVPQAGWKSWKVAMFHQKTGSGVLMRFIPLIM